MSRKYNSIATLRPSFLQVFWSKTRENCAKYEKNRPGQVWKCMKTWLVSWHLRFWTLEGSRKSILELHTLDTMSPKPIWTVGTQRWAEFFMETCCDTCRPQTPARPLQIQWYWWVWNLWTCCEKNGVQWISLPRDVWTQPWLRCSGHEGVIRMVQITMQGDLVHNE